MHLCMIHAYCTHVHRHMYVHMHCLLGMFEGQASSLAWGTQDSRWNPSWGSGLVHACCSTVGHACKEHVLEGSLWVLSCTLAHTLCHSQVGQAGGVLTHANAGIDQHS